MSSFNCVAKSPRRSLRPRLDKIPHLPDCRKSSADALWNRRLLEWCHAIWGEKLVTVNERFAEMFRLSSSGAANFMNLLAFPPFVQAGVTSDILRCLESGDPIVSEPMFARDEGEPFFARIHISRVRSPEGYAIGAQAILEDITQRKIADSELREKSGLINNLLQASPAYFVAVDREGKTIMMNRAMLNAIGHDPDEVVGAPYVATFVPEDERADVSEVFKTLVDEKRATVHRNRLIARGGEEVLCEWHGRPVVRSTGELSFFFIFGIDITAHEAAKERLAQARDELEQRVKERTAELELANRELQAEIAERHSAEDALKKTEEKFRTIFERSLDIILVINTETGHIIAANRAVRTVLQHDPQALIGKHFSTLYPPYPESPVVDSPDDFRVRGAVFEAQEILHSGWNHPLHGFDGHGDSLGIGNRIADHLSGCYRPGICEQISAEGRGKIPRSRGKRAARHCRV